MLVDFYRYFNDILILPNFANFYQKFTNFYNIFIFQTLADFIPMPMLATLILTEMHVFDTDIFGPVFYN